MRTKAMVAAALAAGVVGAGIVAAPTVMAADDSDPAPFGQRWNDGDDDDGWGGPGRGRFDGRGMGPGMGMGGGQMGGGMGRGFGPGDGTGPRADGDCPMYDDLATGTMTDAQKAQLSDYAELEKLSHDVYVALADETGDYRFERIAYSESRHLAALRNVMDRYGVDDPTDGLAEGKFASSEVTAQYKEYVADGSTSLAAALDVAKEIETDDIAELEKAAEGLDEAPAAQQVYEHLAAASQMHLEVFSR